MRRWCWPLHFVLFAIAYASPSSQSFENTAIVRTQELGGAVVHVTTTYAIKALQDALQVYTIALDTENWKKTSWLEVKLKGQKDPLSIEEHKFNLNAKYQLVDITLPRPLAINKTANIVVDTVQTHATYPWPQTAGQNDEQALKYTTGLFVLSPYTTLVQRTKLRTLVPRIISYTTPENVQAFVQENAVSKSGATLTYGPFSDIPPSTTEDFVSQYQNPITIHYHHEQPVLEVLKLKRDVEISHWGANMNTQDEIILHNAGPKLKGHFSRLDHQTQSFHQRSAPHALPALNLQLPTGIRDVYYYDLIGNVSTSHLRVAPSIPRGARTNQYSLLELKPRYPVMGGWNYSFTLGWDAPLGDSVSYDRSTGKYIAEVSIMTPLPGAVVNEAQVSIVLPEGATEVEFTPPFPALENNFSVHTTYLDTAGRPTLTFKYRDLTVMHVKNIYVKYQVTTSAHLKKPLAVATTFFGLFTVAFLARRVNLTIHQKKT